MATSDATSSDPGRQPPAWQGPELRGRSLGSYRVVRLLGAGGMGAVFLGEHPAIGSKVAIKVLHPRMAEDRTLVDRFFNEARVVNLIGHDNIVRALDFGVAPDGLVYCLMEYLDGRPLEALLRRGRPLPLQVAGPIFLQCSRALQAAHDRGVVHRDLKPENVFLIRHTGRDHFVKLLDFGIAKLSGGDAGGRTRHGVVIGTPAYMPPEQAAGDVHRVGPWSDVYSLGVMMFEVATGRLPFGRPGASLAKVLMAHQRDAPPAPGAIEPSVPVPYERLILRCLEKRPEARWPSMAALEKELAACLAGLGLSGALPTAEEVARFDPPPAPATAGPEGATQSTPRPAGDGEPTLAPPALAAEAATVHSTPAPSALDAEAPTLHGTPRPIEPPPALPAGSTLVDLQRPPDAGAESARRAEEATQRLDQEWERKLESGLELDQGGRVFRRCGLCKADNLRTAPVCANCGESLETPDQLAFQARVDAELRQRLQAQAKAGGGGKPPSREELVAARMAPLGSPAAADEEPRWERPLIGPLLDRIDDERGGAVLLAAVAAVSIGLLVAAARAGPLMRQVWRAAFVGLIVTVLPLGRIWRWLRGHFDGG